MEVQVHREGRRDTSSPSRGQRFHFQGKAAVGVDLTPRGGSLTGSLEVSVVFGREAVAVASLKLEFPEQGFLEKAAVLTADLQSTAAGTPQPGERTRLQHQLQGDIQAHAAATA